MNNAHFECVRVIGVLGFIVHLGLAQLTSGLLVEVLLHLLFKAFLLLFNPLLLDLLLDFRQFVQRGQNSALFLCMI